MRIDLDNTPVCVINLPDRNERLSRTREQLSSFYGFDKQIHVVHGIRDTVPFKGVAQAHMNCVRLARENSWPFVVIVEDDVRFQSPDSRAYALDAFGDVPDDFDLLLSGIYSGVPVRTPNKTWDCVREFSALHYYLVRETAYDRILSFDKTCHIDRWMSTSRKYSGCLKAYVTREFFAVQFDGYSDNKGKETEYSVLLQKYKLL